ncbi:hypothetical protein L1049_028398 [Liquidambar formosana]|uniref:Nop domain-containing protein n=1 Tax=Liquidambar formosana TaxID=63359 RepID=A0AAP0RIT8_LIQFO
MVVLVTASVTRAKPPPEENLQKIIDACDRDLALDSAKTKVLDFVESRMGVIAPNLSAVVGSAVAANLIGTAGGLSELVKMPACDVQRLGAKKERTLQGFLNQHLQHENLREEICKEIEKRQEPPPAKQPKPLPAPDSEPKKKRGGRRLRKMNVAKKYKEKHYGSSAATSGLTSSLAFTPVQGIKLTNPQAHADQLGSGTHSTYFSETGFKLASSLKRALSLSDGS